MKNKQVPTSIRLSDKENASSTIWIDNARILAAFAVVLLHVSGIFLRNQGPGSLDWWSANAIHSVVRWCVPVFIMISGFLLINRRKTEKVSTFYQKRAKRIFVPLIFWSVFYYVFVITYHGIPFDLFALNQFFTYLLHGGTHYHLWFLNAIILLYALTPVMTFARKKLSNTQLLALFFVLSAVAVGYNFLIHFNTSFYSPLDINLDLVSLLKYYVHIVVLYLPFYLFGSLIRDIDIRRYRFGAAFGLATTVLLTAIMFYANSISVITLFDNVYYPYSDLSLTVFPMSLLVVLLMTNLHRPLIKNRKVTRSIANLTFGVYLIHALIIGIFSIMNLFNLISPAFISILLFSTLSFLISLALAALIHQIPYLRRII